MFTGHAGLAFAAGRIDRRIHVGFLMVAAYLPDAFSHLSSHMEVLRGYPTHSLASIGVQAVVVCMLGWRIGRCRRIGLLLGALVISHLAVDLLTGTKTMWVGGPKFGLDLYAYPAADWLLEVLIISGGYLLWRRGTRFQARRDLFLPAFLAIAQAVFLYTICTSGMHDCHGFGSATVHL